MVNKRLQVWLPLMFSLVMILGILIGYQLQRAMGWQQNNSSKNLNSTSAEVMELVNRKYVDKLDPDSLNYDAIQAILNRLDPHSIYIPPVNLADVNNELRGNFQGIGIEYQVFNDTLNIMYVVEEGPAAAAGVAVGDQLIKVGDTVIAGKKMGPPDFKKLLRGEGGTQVQLSLLRDSKPLNLTVKRGIIPIPSLDAAYMAAPGVGYLRLNKFAETTYIEFMQSMDKLKPQGMKKLILDLRDNGGGFLDAAVKIADEFLADGKMIVYTEGNKVKRRDYKSDKQGIFETGELIVLMNELSASASEVLAGALQDNDRCTIIGRRSFGKGLVQEQYGLGDGGALRLTIARYYTPLGRSIQKSYEKGRKFYGDEITERFHHRDSLNNDSAYSGGQLYKTKKGKTVYGGGGITPDIYVAFDSASFSEETGRLLSGNTLADFTYRFYKQNKASLGKYNTAGSFDSSFALPEETWGSLLSFAAKDSFIVSAENQRLKNEMLKRIKALLARQLYRNTGYYEVQNTTDPTFRKAMEVIMKAK